MLDQATRDTVKSTAPLLRAQGETLTRHFYARLFEHHPALRQVFNQGHQREGAQQAALAMAVAAYAEHIDDTTVLASVLELVAHKHASLGIRAEHYPLVGQQLLAAMQDVLGEAVATPAVLAAWGLAYGELAEALIAKEQSLYAAAAAPSGGWSGWRDFRVVRKVPESEEITSFHLAAADGGVVPAFVPGQYVSLKVMVPALGYSQPRQYSLSAAPGSGLLRISVKRLAAQEGRPAGMVSSVLHDTVAEGDVLALTPPMGDFQLGPDESRPVVLLSAGVGLTPMVAMLEHLVSEAPHREVWFVHACRHGGVHAFRDHVATLAAVHPQVRSLVYYETPRAQDQAFAHTVGRVALPALEGRLPQDARYFVCGPRAFMHAQLAALRQMGVPEARVHAELFGTGGV